MEERHVVDKTKITLFNACFDLMLGRNEMHGVKSFSLSFCEPWNTCSTAFERCVADKKASRVARDELAFVVVQQGALVIWRVSAETMLSSASIPKSSHKFMLTYRMASLVETAHG